MVVGVSGGQLFAVFWGLGALGILWWFWHGRDRRPKRELGPVVFSAEVGVRFRRGRHQAYSFASG